MKHMGHWAEHDYEHSLFKRFAKVKVRVRVRVRVGVFAIALTAPWVYRYRVSLKFSLNEPMTEASK